MSPSRNVFPCGKVMKNIFNGIKFNKIDAIYLITSEGGVPVLDS